MEIKLEKVNYYYSKQLGTVLKEVNLHFPSGKVIGIMGLTGSGKTTLLELLNGTRIPTSGTITIGENTINKQGILGDIDELHSNIGFLPQFPENKFMYETVLKEISYALEKKNYSPSKRKKHIEQALTMVGLDESYLSRYPFSLSSGESRKVSLAIILACNPKLLLLDEPIIGMDSSDSKHLVSILSTIKARFQKTVVIATNDIDFLNKVADEVVVLKDGKVLLSGDKKEVFKNVNVFKEEGLPLPMVTQFENHVLEKKNISLGHRAEINDLVKDILRSLQ